LLKMFEGYITSSPFVTGEGSSSTVPRDGQNERSPSNSKVSFCERGAPKSDSQTLGLDMIFLAREKNQYTTSTHYLVAG